MKAVLVLENGSVYEGKSSGAGGERIGDVVMDTAVVGYQEIVTDASNAGKIIMLTYPLIGNYGVAKKFNESNKCQVAGLVIKEMSRMHSNWQAEGSLADFLKKENTVTISDIDTRTLAVDIRDNGEMLGIVSTEDFDKESLLKKIKSHKKESFLKSVSTGKPVEFKSGKGRYGIAVLDLGILRSFVSQLNRLDCDVVLLPYDTPADKILSANYNGLVISNGPENDPALSSVVSNVKSILGKLPLLGISTGHLVIGLALGAKLKRLKLGHRGVNYPIKYDGSLKGDITVQNHSFVIDEAGIKLNKDVKITARNVNDQTIEEMESKTMKFISTQYYPASPGLDEVNGVFRRFLNMASKTKSQKEAQYAKT